MKLHATRITKGQDLKLAIANFVIAQRITAGTIVGAAGSLSKVRIRMAGADHTNDGIREYNGRFEIVSLMGMCQGTMHVHISFSDKNGQVLGGHLKEGCIVHTTVELIIAADETLQFTRELDPKTGFDELVVNEIDSHD